MIKYWMVNKEKWGSEPKPETDDNKGLIMKYLIGQRVILTGRGGIEEIGTVVRSESGITRGVWVFSPTKNYASDYDEHNVKPLPNGQL